MFSSKASGPTQGKNGHKRHTVEIIFHYGIIAFSNQAIKDAEFCDRMNESLGGNVLQPSDADGEHPRLDILNWGYFFQMDFSISH